MEKKNLKLSNEIQNSIQRNPIIFKNPEKNVKKKMKKKIKWNKNSPKIQKSIKKNKKIKKIKKSKQIKNLNKFEGKHQFFFTKNLNIL